MPDPEVFVDPPDPDPVIIRRRDHVIELGGRFKEAIFEKKVKKYYFHEKVSYGFKEALDEENEYITNSYGYRGPEFKSDLDILAIGCSQTYGIGVPEEGTWPAFLAKKTGMSYANLSAPGASIEWLVHSTFSYVHEFGPPKIIAALFPDFFRMEIVMNSDINQSRTVSMRDWNAQGIDPSFAKGVITSSYIDPDLKWRAKLSKRPFPIEDTVPAEEPIFRSFKLIMMLERYCEALGIELLWSGWSDDVSRFLVEYEGTDYYPNYAFNCWGLHEWESHFKEIPKTKDDPEGIKDRKIVHDPANASCMLLEEDVESSNSDVYCTCVVDCHSEYIDQFSDSFYHGTDRHTRGLGNSHMGVHKHLHIADDFYDKLVERGAI